MFGSTLADTLALCYVLGAPPLGGVSPHSGGYLQEALLLDESFGWGGLLLGRALTHQQSVEIGSSFDLEPSAD